MTGSERAKQRRQDRLLAYSIFRYATDSEHLPNVHGVVEHFRCTHFQAERAIRLLIGETYDRPKSEAP